MVSSFPPLIAALAVAKLTTSSALEDLMNTFFGMTILDQIALVAFVMAMVVMVVSVYDFRSAGERERAEALARGDDDDHLPPFPYPLKAIEAASTDKDKFVCLFDPLRDSIAEHMSHTHEMIPEAVSWIVEMMDYTCPGGKLNRGTTVLAVVRSFGKNNDHALTTLEEARACVLGWAIEFLQAFFLVADDLMDDSKTRRGQPCWYLVPKVGKIAVNDSFLLESFVFTLITRHFGSETYYTRLLELFLEVTQQTECGQLLDLTSQSNDPSAKTDLSRFTMERYCLIVKYKTAFYSFYLPVAIGMIISGVTDEISHKVAKRICCAMGEYFQIQDDYLDCYGTPEMIGKIGTDIQDNKCSWLVVQALKRANPEQRKMLEENYGQWDDSKVAKVKELYNELDLTSVFLKYEEESYMEIKEEMDKITSIPNEVFSIFLDKIYKRKK